MSLLNFDAAPFDSDSLVGSTNELISQPNVVNTQIVQEGSGKGKKKSVKKTVSKKSKSDKKTKTVKTDKKVKTEKKDSKKVVKIVKKVKEINKYSKVQLEKVAKKHSVNCKTREGKLKTKQQLFNSLKRKKLI
jgi:hypothetical protein